jgi:hypothetical protein
MAARKLAVSLDEDLAARIVRAADEDTGGNVSAWLAEAARARLRYAAGRQLLKDLVADEGPITDEERERVRREWPRD